MSAIYALWALLPTLVANSYRRRKALATFLFVAIASAVCIFQNEAANKDRENYSSLIKSAAEGDFTAMEPGFILLAKTLSTLVSGTALQTAFFLLVAIGSLSIKLPLFARYGISLFGCLASYISYFFLVHEMTQIRIGFAIGLLYFSWIHMAERDWGKYWLYGIASTLFHFSGIIFLFGPLLFSIRNRARWLFTLAILTALAAVSVAARSLVLERLADIFASAGIEKVAIYFDLLRSGTLAQISPLRLLPHTFLLIIAASQWQSWKSDSLSFFFFQIYLTGALTFIILSPIPALAYRVSDIFLFAGIFVIGRLRARLTNGIYWPLVVLYSGASLTYTLNYSGLFMWNA